MPEPSEIAEIASALWTAPPFSGSIDVRDLHSEELFVTTRISALIGLVLLGGLVLLATALLRGDGPSRADDLAEERVASIPDAARPQTAASESESSTPPGTRTAPDATGPAVATPTPASPPDDAFPNDAEEPSEAIAAAPSPTTPATRMPRSPMRAIRATVVGNDGELIQGAYVRWVPESGDRSLVRSLRTGTDGDVLLSGIPRVPGTLFIRHREYRDDQFDLPGAELGPIEMELSAGGVIEAEIRMSGDPLADAVVVLRRGTESRSAVSDGDGRVRIQGLVPGNYTLRVTALGHAATEEVGENPETATPPRHEPLTVVLESEDTLEVEFDLVERSVAEKTRD